MALESVDVAAIVREECAAYAMGTGTLLEILHEVQAHIGYIPDEAIRLIANELNMSRAQVFGVVTFYHDFRRKPQAAHTLKVCRAEACQSVGGREVWAAATIADTGGQVDVEPVYCLGNCACAPAVQYDGRTIGRVDVPRVSALLASSGANGAAS